MQAAHEARAHRLPDPAAEDEICPPLRHVRQQPVQPREPAAEHDHVRVEQVHHLRQRACQPVLVALQAGLRQRIAAGGTLADLQGARGFAAVIAVVARQARAAEPGLDAAVLAAVARRCGRIAGIGPGQGVVTPFAGQAVRPDQQPAIDDDAGAHAGAQDCREHHGRAGAGAVGRLRQRQAVRVVGDAHRPPECERQVVRQRPAVQAGRVGVLDQAFAGGGAGRADAHAARGQAQVGLGPRDQRGDSGERGAIVAGRGGDALAPQAGAMRVEHDGFDLGAAEIDADGRRR